MKSFTMTDLNRKAAALFEAAIEGPVMVRRRRKDVAVIMSAFQYMKYASDADIENFLTAPFGKKDHEQIVVDGVIFIQLTAEEFEKLSVDLTATSSSERAFEPIWVKPEYDVVKALHDDIPQFPLIDFQRGKASVLDAAKSDTIGIYDGDNMACYLMPFGSFNERSWAWEKMLMEIYIAMGVRKADQLLAMEFDLRIQKRGVDVVVLTVAQFELLHKNRWKMEQAVTHAKTHGIVPGFQQGLAAMSEEELLKQLMQAVHLH